MPWSATWTRRSGGLDVESQEDLASLTMQRRLAHPPEAVWHALTNQEETRQWMPTPYTTLDDHVDGHVEIDGPLHITGRILKWDPSRVFEHEFCVAPCKAAPTGEDAVVRYEIEPDGDGCILTVTLTRFTPATVRAFSGGLPKGLDRLETYLESTR